MQQEIPVGYSSSVDNTCIRSVVCIVFVLTRCAKLFIAVTVKFYPLMLCPPPASTTTMTAQLISFIHYSKL
uniref:Uncharacterized protein n=1 Tax=Arundo donax TaxID=35708 RepID=A0A0A9EWK6_ARUDO